MQFSPGIWPGFFVRKPHTGVLVTTDTPNEKLTHREKQVAALVAEGLSNAAIAERLGISVETIKDYMQGCLRKLKFTNRTELAIWHVKKTLQKGYDPQKVFIVFGGPDTLRENKDRCIHEYVFDSVPEVRAFLQGLAAGDSWTNYHQADTREAALAYIEDVTADLSEEWKFTACDNGGNRETFDGYDTQAEAAAAIDRLRLNGYTDFSAPKRAKETDDDK